MGQNKLTYFSAEKSQDRWVIEDVFKFKRDGFFLDLAAGHPTVHSNTYTLESQLGWRGICIEPNPGFFAELGKVRTCHLSNQCIDRVSREVEFVCSGELGGIVSDTTDNNERTRANALDRARAKGQVQRLKTTPLAQVLRNVGAPREIDYFSFDVEGAEEAILETFPFWDYLFRCLTIERPTPLVNEWLLANGYTFIRNCFDGRQNEDTESFYIHSSIDDGTLEREPFRQVPRKRW